MATNLVAHVDITRLTMTIVLFQWHAKKKTVAMTLFVFLG
jgi:hypothetical protein